MRDKTGNPVLAAAAVQPGAALTVQFSDGAVRVTAEPGATRKPAAKAEPAKPAEPKGQPRGESRVEPKKQGSLF